MGGVLFTAFLIALAAGYLVGRAKGRTLAAQSMRVHSLPVYHGSFVALATSLPILTVMIAWPLVFGPMIENKVLGQHSEVAQSKDAFARHAAFREVQNAAANKAAWSAAKPDVQKSASFYSELSRQSAIGQCLTAGLLALLGLFWSKSKIKPEFKAQAPVETFVSWVLLGCSVVAVLTTVGIVASVLFESLRFFAKYPVLDFLFGTKWSPQIAMREDQVGQTGAFGILPLLVGTVLITLIAMTVALPIGLFSAIYMAEYASPRFRSYAKPMLEILAGVPTVVFGFFAAITVAPLIRSLGTHLGLDVASESALAAGLVMGVMIIPFVSSLSDDVINAVPQSLRDGAFALGSTKSETIKNVVLPAALAGIVSAIMLAVSRAIGETMIVVMAAGLAGKLSFNPLDAVTTITVQIKTLLVGDQEFDSPKTLAAFALGLVLFFFTLTINWIALRIVGKYREQYE